MKENRFCFGLVLCFLLTIQTQWGIAEETDQNLLAVSLPTDPVPFQPGSGSHLASGYCLICHSAEYVYMQPLHEKETWSRIVHKMKQVFGCPIPDKQIPVLVKYLLSQNKVQPIPVAGKVHQSISSQPIRKGDPAKGQKVYDSHCRNCHGKKGKGDGPIGRLLVPPAANLTIVEKKSDEALLKTIQNGRSGTAMPPWKQTLSQEKIFNVLAFIRRLGQS